MDDDLREELGRRIDRHLGVFERIATALETLAAQPGFPSPLHVIIDPTPTPTPGPAVHATFAVGGPQTMSNNTFTVDAVNEQLVGTFTDDRGDSTSPPAGVMATATFDNPLLSAGASSVAAGSNSPWNDTLNIPLTVAAGSAVTGPTVVNATSALTGPAGAPLFEADGVTPFPQPAPVAITVDPGAAVGVRFSTAP